MTVAAIDDPALVAELVPTGRLRAVINLGNALLAHRQPDSPEPLVPRSIWPAASPACWGWSWT